MHAQSWQDRAAAKRASILAEIPAEWRLAQADIDRAEKQRVLVGPFMEQLLDPETVSIVNKDSVPLVEAIKSRTYTSEQVTRAFCKTAAVAHQIVSVGSPRQKGGHGFSLLRPNLVGPVPPGVFPRVGHRAGPGAGPVPRREWPPDGPPARLACQSQGPVPCQGTRHDHGLRRMDRWQPRFQGPERGS